MIKNAFTFLSLLLVLILQSCETSSIDSPEPQGAYENGFFIINEGPYGNGSGSLTFVDTNFNYVEQNVFQNVNGESLGNVVQSMALSEDNAYIVVNNAHKIVIANRFSMEKLGSIETGLNNPRYMIITNGKAYVSNWGSPFDSTDDFIAVIDLDTNEVIQTIAVSEGPEKMELIGDKIVVAMQGGWGFNNKISIINTSNNTLQTSIDLGYIPNSMIVKDQALYVLSGGIPSWSWTLPESAGQITKIDTDSFTIVDTWDFDTSAHPGFLSFDGTSLLYNLNGNIFKWNGADALPTTPENGLGGYYYGMSAKNNLLFTLDAADFASEGTLKIFYLASNNQIQSIPTGIIPNAVVFN